MALAAATDHDLGGVDVSLFEDGERLVRIEDGPSDHAVVVVTPTTGGTLIEGLQIQDAVREAGASEITTVLPYLDYSRLQKTFRASEPISARAMARAISTEADRIVLVNPHESGIQAAFDAPVEVVDASPQLAAPLANLTDPVVAAASGDAPALAERLHEELDDGTLSTLAGSGEDRRLAAEIDLAGRPVVLVDDLIASGSTMAGAATAVADRGAERVIAACIHPILADHARLRLERAGVDRIVATDTVEQPVSRTSAAPAIAPAIAPPE